MPLKQSIEERLAGLQGYSIGTAQGAIEVPFLVTGFTDEADMCDWALANAPQSRGTYKIESVVRFEAMQPDDGVWNVFIRYTASSGAFLSSGLDGFSFRTTGGSQHIRSSIRTVTRVEALGVTPVDHQRAIGVTADGSVDGVDIDVAVFEWSETWRFPLKDVIVRTGGSLRPGPVLFAIYELTDTVCDGPFRFCDEGEARLLGAEGCVNNLLSFGPDSDFMDVTLSFAGSRNRDDIFVGKIGPIVKKGWEYMWAEYEQTSDDSASRLGVKVVQVNIEQVYYDGDFSGLGIGN